MSTAKRFNPAVMVGRPDEKPWSETVGQAPDTIWVGERPDKKWTVYLRWQVNRKPQWKSLGFVIRDSRGDIIKREKTRALDAATKAQVDWSRGIAPNDTKAAAVQAQAPAAAPQTSQAAAHRAQQKRTLAYGFTLALNSSDGIHVKESHHVLESRARAEDIMAALTDQDGPGGLKTWDDVRPHTAVTVWRYILRITQEAWAAYRKDQAKPEEAREGVPEPKGDGHRRAQKAVAVLYQVSRWLHDRDDETYPLRKPPKGWLATLKEEWRQETGVHPDSKEQPRFDEDELRRMFSSLELADPRVALLIESGAEQRAGQVIRTKRSNLNLDPVGGFGLGQLDMRDHGHGKKHTTIIDLHPELRARIDDELKHGYLRELEAAYQRHIRGEEGGIPDYHLFPAAKLRRGAAPIAKYLAKTQHILATSLSDLLKKYEELVGVKHVKGRGFYGLRRALADAAEDVTTDTRVLREITGWKSEEMRKHYQKKKRPESLAGAAEVRHAIRGKFRLVEVTDGGEFLQEETASEMSAEAKLEALLSNLPPALRDQVIQAMLQTPPRPAEPEREPDEAELNQQVRTREGGE